MLAPAVAELIVTNKGAVNVCAVGLNVGASTITIIPGLAVIETLSKPKACEFEVVVPLATE